MIPVTKTVVIITDQYFLYMRAQSFLDQIFNSNATEQLLLSEKLSNISTYKVFKFDEGDETNPKYFFKIRFKKMSERREDDNQVPNSGVKHP